MNTPMRAAAAVAIIAVVGIAAFSLLGGGSNVGGPPTPRPTASTMPSPTAAPTAAATVLGPIDTATWTTYTSTRYRFTIGHPGDWPLTPSNHDWAFPADATDFPPTGGETFRTPADDVAVSAWSVAVARGTTITTWLQMYCPVAESNSCASLEGLTTTVSMDGHAGTLVAFKEDTQAFILIGDRMYIVGCWRAESDPTVAPYGGATRLVEGFLSTMHLLPTPTPVPTARPT